MPVSALNNWDGRKDGDPDGASLSISAGSDRTLILVYTAETGTHSFTSLTVGGVSATGQNISVSSIESNTHIWSWYWDETAVAAMSASATVALTKTGTPTHHDWDYAVFQGVAGGATYATDVDVAAGDTSITATSATSVNDWLVVMINRESANRDVTAYDNLTEEWQYNVQYTIAVADGQGGDDTVSLTGDGFSGSWLVQLLHLKAGAGSPAVLLKALHEGMLGGE